MAGISPRVTSGKRIEIQALERKLLCNQAITCRVVLRLEIALMEPYANNFALVTENR